MRTISILLFLPLLGLAGLGEPRTAGQPMLVSVRQIRDLSPAQAAQGLPAQLRGVVTLCNTNLDDGMYLQDATGGINVKFADQSNFCAGDDLEVRAVTQPGKFVPVVRAQSIRLLGTAPLPAPLHFNYDDMVSGREACQWGEVEGMVRSVVPGTKGRTNVELLVNGQRIVVQVARFNLADAEALIGATVRIQGVCRTVMNSKRQLSAPYLSAGSLSNFVVETPAPREIAEVPLASLMQFNAEGGYYGRRVKVRGVVTAQIGNAVFIQEDKAGLYFKCGQPGRLAPGTLVEVIGFPAPGQNSAMLEDATVHVIGKGSLPPPLNISMNDLLSGDCDALLVRFTGRLIHRFQRAGEYFLVLQRNDFIVTARLASSEADWRFKTLREGSELEMTGVCLAQPLDNSNLSLVSRPEEMQLLLRASSDVALIRNPPWWTLSRLLWMLGIMGVVILGGFAWVFALDRRVRRQTAIIEQKLRHEAMLEERGRIAREFHDSLEQELVAIAIQLDTVDAQFQSAPAVARKMLELARNMARRSLVEARRSVWDLRSFMLENSSLPAALSEVVKLMAPNSQLPISVQTSGEPRKLSLQVETNLLRIAQEALSNALRHAKAAHVEIRLAYEPGKVRMRVHDDGIGFECAQPPAVYGGHFGLLDMSERMKKMGGTFSLASRPGRGTEIMVEIADKLETVPEPALEVEEEPPSAQPIIH